MLVLCKGSQNCRTSSPRITIILLERLDVGVVKPAFSGSRRAVYRLSLAQDTSKKTNIITIDRLGFREGARVLLHKRRLAPKPCGAPCGIYFLFTKLQVHQRLPQENLCTKLACFTQAVMLTSAPQGLIYTTLRKANHFCFIFTCARFYF